AAIVGVDASALPIVDVDASVQGLDARLDGETLAVTLAENLATEAEAMRTADGALLGAVDGAGRLAEMQARLDEALATGRRSSETYVFDRLGLSVYETGDQSGAALAFDGRGTVTEVVYDHNGEETDRSERSFDSLFVLSQVAGDRWRLVEVGSRG
ncbi:MAG: hypothetical protein WCE80_09810, partial [Acidimicrobiia bacterium]